MAVIGVYRWKSICVYKYIYIYINVYMYLILVPYTVCNQSQRILDVNGTLGDREEAWHQPEAPPRRLGELEPPRERPALFLKRSFPPRYA